MAIDVLTNGLDSLGALNISLGRVDLPYPRKSIMYTSNPASAKSSANEPPLTG